MLLITVPTVVHIYTGLYQVYIHTSGVHSFNRCSSSDSMPMIRLMIIPLSFIKTGQWMNGTSYYVSSYIYICLLLQCIKIPWWVKRDYIFSIYEWGWSPYLHPFFLIILPKTSSALWRREIEIELEREWHTQSHTLTLLTVKVRFPMESRAV